MPANFGEIASYHSRLAARYLALAQSARDEGNFAEAEHQTALAARYIQAAQEQRIAMRTEPFSVVKNVRAKGWPMEQPRRPLIAVCLLAAMRGPGQIARAIRQSLPKRKEPFHSLTLR
ncbi:MAG: hypothetical protein ABSG00_05155 [Terracidiphilus sp.]|jgi:hypothetical protein